MPNSSTPVETSSLPAPILSPSDRHRLVHYADYLVQPAVFFRRSVFEQVGGLDASLHWAMDYDFWLKASAVTRFQYILTSWPTTDGSASAKPAVVATSGCAKCAMSPPATAPAACPPISVLKPSATPWPKPGPMPAAAAPTAPPCASSPLLRE